MELLTMQTNQFKVGDIVKPNAHGNFIYKLLYDRLSEKDVLRVDAVGSTMVRIKPVNRSYTFDMLFHMLDVVPTAVPEPIFTPARPTEPSPSLAAAYGKSFKDMTNEEVSQYLADKPRTDAVSIMQSGIDAMTDRAAERDSETERSMSAAVAAFNALHGTNLTEELGWQFMVLLKMSRAKGGKFRLDDYIDGAAYNALAGEAAAKERQ